MDLKLPKDPNRKYSVLFVDDEQRVTRALKSMFRANYQVFTANSGQEALCILDKNDIDVIVSDQRMPNMLGHELLARVETLFPRVMRILLTGFTDQEAIISNINEGQVYRFINKPWVHEDIQRIVAEAARASDFEMHKAIQDVEAINMREAIIHRAVHVIENSPEIQIMLKDFDLMKGARITASNNFEDALEVIDNNIYYGVLVLKIWKNTPETIQIISILKQIRPELQTIVVAKQSDSDFISELINVGQIFRYFSYPCDPLVLEESIEQAFKSYMLLWNQQKAHARVKVEQRELALSEKVKNIFSKFGLNKARQEA